MPALLIRMSSLPSSLWTRAAARATEASSVTSIKRPYVDPFCSKEPDGLCSACLVDGKRGAFSQILEQQTCGFDWRTCVGSKVNRRSRPVKAINLDRARRHETASSVCSLVHEVKRPPFEPPLLGACLWSTRLIADQATRKPAKAHPYSRSPC